MQHASFANDLRDSSTRIAHYLAARQSVNGSFPAREFYGKAFAALLWSMTGPTFRTNTEAALRSIAAANRGLLPVGYHFEFNRYALLKLFAARPNFGNIDQVMPIERYRGTRVANWTLLRAFCRLHSGHLSQRTIGRAEVAVVHRWFSDKSGLIEDQRGAYTSQYHAFCAALLGELTAGPLNDSKRTLSWFKQATDSFVQWILPGGQCNYIGRGSLQSFGYAAAILALAHASRAFGDPNYVEKAAEIFRFVKRFQRVDGSLPLVLREGQEGQPDTFDLQDPVYAGWWSYNNYYDYLPFSGALLRLAAELFQNHQPRSCTRVSAATSNVQVSRIGDALVRVQTKNYNAVFTLPNRRLWAASLPIPYLEVGGVYPFPCYSGEQRIASIYNERGLPLPIVRLQDEQELVFARLPYHWIHSTGFCTHRAGVVHHRTMRFGQDEIFITDRLTAMKRAAVKQGRLLRIMLPAGAFQIESATAIRMDGLALQFGSPFIQEPEDHYSATGQLACFYMESGALPPGGTASASLTIRLSARSGVRL